MVTSQRGWVFQNFRLSTSGSQSGPGLPHSKTSRKKSRVIRRQRLLFDERVSELEKTAQKLSPDSRLLNILPVANGTVFSTNLDVRAPL